jgi:3-oxoacyl-[acyl-carrier protein] reductase
MAFDFIGRTAVVTGAAHGFGRAIAQAFAANGARVFACDVNAAVTESGDDLRGGRALVFDVGSRDAVQNVIAEITATGAQIDILVNNAGGVRGQVGRPIEQVSGEDWQAIFDANLSGVFYMAQAVAPGMKARKRGRIVNISSGAGLGITLTGIQAYASSKAGQIGLTRQLAHELGPFGITVNNVAPGFVLSNPTTVRQWDAMGAEGQSRLLASIALQRLGTPQDVANAVMFFCSDAANWITGQVLSVDGGR